MADISKINPNGTVYNIKDPYALRLNMTALGTENEPYVLDYNDLPPHSGIRVSYMDVTTSPNVQCNMGSTDWGDWYIYNFYGGNSAFGTLLAFGPRDRNHIFIGHFWDGTWTGWNFISTNQEFIDSNVFGAAETTGFVTMALPDYVKTAKLYGVTIFGEGWRTTEDPLILQMYHGGTYSHQTVGQCQLTDLNTKFGTNFQRGQRLFFNVHLEW